MTITREQVADLREGDVVELTFEDGYHVRRTYRGSLRAAGESLYLADLSIRSPDGRASRPNDDSLTVVSRAPRPLYVNHPRTEPAIGDVVSVSFARDIPIMKTRNGWLDPLGQEWDPKRKDGLRLLVDGETGQVVP